MVRDTKQGTFTTICGLALQAKRRLRLSSSLGKAQVRAAKHAVTLIALQNLVIAATPQDKPDRRRSNRCQHAHNHPKSRLIRSQWNAAHIHTK